jgi:rare lipoprotein A
MMNILSENSLLNVRAISTVRRVVSIAIGATVGISMGLTSVQAGQPSSSLLSGFHSIGNLELASPTPIVVPSADAPMRTKISGHSGLKWYQMGLASWYGGKFQGRQTASGEDFDSNTLTCAHRTLPLGTWVKITNLRNHKWVVVRVNDRGPVPETRIVDLSSAAAHMLGIHKRGVSRVRLDVIDPQQAEEVARLERLRGLRAAQGQATLQAQAEGAPQ